MEPAKIKELAYTFGSVNDFSEYLTNLAKSRRDAAARASSKKSMESLKAQAFEIEQIADIVAHSNLTVREP